jgi:SAM-dependent methyltransferase
VDAVFQLVKQANNEYSQRQWYTEYYARTGADRNDLLRNPGTLLQNIAGEISFIRAARHMELEPATARLLDVGCGTGANLFQFFRLGFRARNTTAIDILPERVAQANELLSHCQISQADASAMPFSDADFDVVSESTMFAVLVEDAVRRAIANEMMRVTRPGGYLLLVDWRTPNPFSREYKALSRSELNSLFHVGSKTKLIGVFRGALVPPLGRRLSAWVPALYFPIVSLFPPLVGQVTYLLQRN